MFTERSQKQRLPPYVSYRTFRNFIEGLQQQIPARIDRSYWGDMLSGSTGMQLMAALRFLGLIDTNGRPTARLKSLVTAQGEQRTELLKEIVSGAFSFVLQGTLDLHSATYAQLEEVFHDRFQLTEDVSRKCIKFFIALASDAGMPLSPFITKRFRSTRVSSGTRTITKRATVRTNRNIIIPQGLEEIPDQMSWYKMLLTKFPTFDPTWNDEVKLKWFAAFDKLLEQEFPQDKK